ncbi:MAG: class III extradiol dioxygenase family protein [Beijerinckiaceae bacterium]|nr:class III extradiol dioxygenase family protein [Beijerinckiaceae bacterium]
MANVIGGLATSHVPSIGGAIAKGLQQDPYWKPFFDAFDPIHEFLEREKPDVAVVIYNDHGLSHFLDKMPTFAVGAAEEYKNADEGWGIPVLPPFAGHAALSWHIIESLVNDEFDITSCQEHLVDHAFSLPLKLMYPDAKWPVRTVPITINSVQHPLPSALRCWKLGQAIGRALESWPGAEKIVVLGTGGLSHQLDGARAGFINKDFDLLCLDKIVNDPVALTKYSNKEIIELAGSQGVELMCWIAMRGALQGRVSKLHSTYHVPISNTGGAVLLMENKPRPHAMAAE